MAKKISSWKQKSVYTILAPENFDSGSIGETLSKDPKNLLGRTVDVSLRDLVGDKSKQHLKILFEISGVNGDKAATRFKAFNVNPGYLRSKVRKGSSKIDCIENIKLTSGEEVQVRIVAVTHDAVKTSRSKELRVKVGEILGKYSESNLDDFVQATLFGKLGTEIYRDVKKIVPVRRVEIEQVKVI